LSAGCGDTGNPPVSIAAERTPKNPLPPAKVKLGEAAGFKTPAETYDHIIEIYEEALALLEWIESREDALTVKPRLDELQMELKATKDRATKIGDRPFDVMHRYLEKGTPLCEKITKRVNRLQQKNIEPGWPALGVLAVLDSLP
jgi:hypothetical protein